MCLQLIISGTDISPSLLSLAGKYLRQPSCIEVTERENAQAIVRGPAAGTVHEYIETRQQVQISSDIHAE